MRALRHNGLTLTFLALMVLCLIGQAIAGLHVERAELVSHHAREVPGLLDYVTSSSYGGHVLENWESEFMQFFMFILATIWLVQRGSAETKAPGDEGSQETWLTQSRQRFLRANGLLLVMFLCFVLTWFGQSMTGWREFNQEQLLHGDPQLTWGAYVQAADFWEKTFQNWQSEFLAVAAMSIFTVYLRQAGSSESKRLDTPHEANEPTY
jgi:hypothetical protein